MSKSDAFTCKPDGRRLAALFSGSGDASGGTYDHRITIGRDVDIKKLLIVTVCEGGVGIPVVWFYSGKASTERLWVPWLTSSTGTIAGANKSIQRYKIDTPLPPVEGSSSRLLVITWANSAVDFFTTLWGELTQAQDARKEYAGQRLAGRTGSPSAIGGPGLNPVPSFTRRVMPRPVSGGFIRKAMKLIRNR